MNQMPHISADDVISWQPCEEWTPERIRELFPEPVSALDVCDLRRFRGASIEDRLWVLLREEVLPARELRLLACDCAERALRWERRAGREPDERSWSVVAVSRRYANGEASDEELAAAEAAAWAAWDARPTWAAEAAAEAAAWAVWDATPAWDATAARAAAWAADRAAWGAACTAAWAACVARAAGVAAWAAWDAERRWQLKRVARYLRSTRG